MEAESFVVRFPLPKLTEPVPESVNPPLRLMAPPETAVIVPWQVDRIADRARTAEALPGRHRERCAQGVGQTQAAVDWRRPLPG